MAEAVQPVRSPVSKSPLMKPAEAGLATTRATRPAARARRMITARLLTSKPRKTRKARKNTNRKLTDDAFVLQLGVMTEVHQEAELVSGGFQVIVNLSAVLVAELGHGLDF